MDVINSGEDDCNKNVGSKSEKDVNGNSIMVRDYSSGTDNKEMDGGIQTHHHRTKGTNTQENLSVRNSNNENLYTSYKRQIDCGTIIHTFLNMSPSSPSSQESETHDILHNFAHVNLTRSKKEDAPKGLNLVKFITAGISSHLKTLGVEDLDCKEYVETWLSDRRQKRWKQSLPSHSPNFMEDRQFTYSNTCLSLMQNKGVYLLKPDMANSFNRSGQNSSLIRLTGEGNEELEQFLERTEQVRTNLNNASCTLLQGTMVLLLPYFKLLTGNQLATPKHQIFIEDWIQIITGMVSELRPGAESKKETKIMLVREYQSLLSESRRLYTLLSKLFKKVKHLYKENDKSHKKSLGRLHPKSLTNRSRFDRSSDDKDGSLEQKVFLNEALEFAPIPLYRANIATADLFKDHVYFSRSKKGGKIIFKSEINRDWESFADLTFQRRRELLLSVLEDLRWSMNSAATSTSYIKELFIDGYPESVCGKIKDNLTYLKKMSKQDEVLVLSKVTIANQVKSFLNTLARLVRILKDTTEVSQKFYKCIKHSEQRCTNTVEDMAKDENDNLNKVETVPSTKFDNAKVKLLLSLPISTHPVDNQLLRSIY